MLVLEERQLQLHRGDSWLVAPSSRKAEEIRTGGGSLSYVYLPFRAPNMVVTILNMF